MSTEYKREAERKQKNIRSLAQFSARLKHPPSYFKMMIMIATVTVLEVNNNWSGVIKAEERKKGRERERRAFVCVYVFQVSEPCFVLTLAGGNTM